MRLLSLSVRLLEKN